MSVGYAPGNGHSGSSCLLARAQMSSESSPHRACGDMSVDLGMYSGIKAQQGRGWPGKMAWRHHRGACWCARLCHAWDPGAPRSEHPAPRRCWVLVPPRLPRQRCRLVPRKQDAWGRLQRWSHWKQNIFVSLAGHGGVTEPVPGCILAPDSSSLHSQSALIMTLATAKVRHPYLEPTVSSSFWKKSQ